MQRVMLLFIGVLILATAAGAAQVTIAADSRRACSGLSCYDNSDCGSYCRCDDCFGICFPPAP